VHAVGDGISDQKVDDGGHRPVGKDLDEGVDLALLPHRAHFEEGKAGVHGKNHDRPEQEKKHVSAMVQGCWGRLHCLTTSLSVCSGDAIVTVKRDVYYKPRACSVFMYN
jgi:hypothetical protein